MNGYGLKNYAQPPSGWDWTDLLVQPHIYAFNHVVMSQNGEKPIYYEGWHQTDVLRIKALEQLDILTRQHKPFYLEIAPASPHVRIGGWPTVPLARHMFHFPGATAPRTPNWNPLDDEEHSKKPAWVGMLEVMNRSVVEAVDRSFRARLQGLQGVDEIVEDVFALLERRGVLEDTFVIYTTDNGESCSAHWVQCDRTNVRASGFHLGNHRVSGGKGLPYIEDTNLPLAVRGPGIPRARQLSIPSSHVDMAPTLLDIAGVPPEDWPEFFDGRSLLSEWQNQESKEDGISREVLNVEFWGSTVAPKEEWTTRHHDNTYKSLRLVGEKQGWLFNRWCTSNQTELYNTIADPYELHNLAVDPSDEIKRVMNRLSGLLLVTKSCGRDSCRKPWDVLRSSCDETVMSDGEATFSDLEGAMDSKYDAFFASLPHFGFHSCVPYQKVENEGPYFPAESEDLGRRYRAEEDGTVDAVSWMAPVTPDVESEEYFGDLSQRYATADDLERTARALTEAQMGSSIRCTAPDYCVEMYED